MYSYNKIITYIPHSSIENYAFGWNNLYQTAVNNSFQMFATAKRLTDWHADLLFGIPMSGVACCRFPYSRLFVDLDGDPSAKAGENGVIITDIDGHTRTVGEKNQKKMMQIYHDFMGSVKDEIVENTLILDCRTFTSESCPGTDILVSGGENPPEDALLEYVRNRFRRFEYKYDEGKLMEPETVKVSLSDEDYIFLLKKCVRNFGYSLNRLTIDYPRLGAEIYRQTAGGWDEECDFAEWPFLILPEEAVEDAKKIREIIDTKETTEGSSRIARKLRR